MNRNLVPDLQVERIDPGRPAERERTVIIISGDRTDLGQSNALQQGREIEQRTFEWRIAREHVVGQRHQRPTVTGNQRLEQTFEVAAIDHAEHLAHRAFFDATAAVRNRLIEQRQGIAHAASGCASDLGERGRREGHRLGLEHSGQMTRDQGRRQVLEVELQAAGQHGHRHLARIGGRKDEDHMGGRLFKRLEHRIEGMPAEHVDLVDHVDLVATRDRRIDHLFEQLRHFLDAAIGGGIHFDIVGKPALLDRDAGATLPAGPRADARFAVERPRQDARNRGLADAARAGKQIGMVQPTGIERVAECANHMLLADERLEISRSPGSGERLMRLGGGIGWGAGCGHRDGRCGCRRWINRESTALAAGRRVGRWTSLTLGTSGKRHWLLPSGPDQVDHTGMRGGPSALIVSVGRDRASEPSEASLPCPESQRSTSNSTVPAAASTSTVRSGPGALKGPGSS